MENRAYDKIIKENLLNSFLAFAKNALDLDIVKSEQLPEKMQTTLEREVDFARIVTVKSGDRFILHIEFQSQNEAEMIYRMAEYRAILQRKYRLAVRQIVVYIGKEKSNMKFVLPVKEQITGFELLDIQTLAFEQLLNTSTPESVILAILANFEGIDPEEIIDKIIGRLLKLSPNKAALKKYIVQLSVLAKLRKLASLTIKKTKNMPITYNIETDEFYLQGIQKGEARGIVKGEARAEAKIKKVIERMLLEGFEIQTIAKMFSVTNKYVLDIKSNINKESNK